jgi:hypothetical protein
LVELSFWLNNETMTKVKVANGIEIMPGLSRGIGAELATRPYLSYMVGENRIIPMDETIPTIIDHAMPLAVVFFQNKRNNIAGRFAEAATANASPTRNETFMPLKRIPRRIAKRPTPIAAILPAFTFPLSVISTCRYLSIKSWAMAPEEATISPLTVPNTVAKAMAEIIENNPIPIDLANSGPDILLLSISRTPPTIAPRPIYNVRI